MLAAVGWGAPVRLAGPYPSDVSAPVASVSRGGEVAAAFSVFNLDDPAVSQAWLATRSARGRTGRPRRLHGMRQALDVDFAGRRLVALGTAGGGGELVVAGHGRRVGTRVAGEAVGELEPLGAQGVLAAVGSSAGVWVKRTGARAHRLTRSSAHPSTLASTATGGGHAVVGWLEGPRAIVAGFSARRGVARPHPALVAGRRDTLDELALAPEGRRVTVAAIESWFDRAGVYHSVVDVAGRRIAVAGQAASGLALAGSAGGTQALAFKSCEATARCWVRVAYRRGRRGRLSGAARLGAIDPDARPAVALTGNSTAVVAWVFGGRPYAVWRAPGGRFTAPHSLSGSGLASGLTLAGGPGAEAVAVWTQGTLRPSIVGAELR